MKKTFIILSILLLSGIVSAQQGYKYVYADYGYTINSGGNNFSIGLDFPNRYHNSWDIGIRGYLKPSYESLFLVLRYKPIIYKGIHSTFKGRSGILGGTDFSKAVFAPELGLEYCQTLAFGFDFYVASDIGYYINSPIDRWRVNAIAGFKIRF